jgi:hypothetical protein
MTVSKAYIRHNGTYPCDESVFAAMRGFEDRGVETDKFYGFGDIHNLKDLGHDVLLAGYIGDVWKALDAMGVGRPPSLDYPEELVPFLGREIRVAKLGDIRNRNTEGVFVKPVVQKLFTGFVCQGTYDDRIRLAPYPEDEDVFVSEVVPFVSEYRCYVLRDAILSACHYKGDWSKVPNRETVELAVAAYTEAPVAYTQDFGVTADGRTLLIEVNDGFAVGNYGLSSTLYAQLLEARWQELVP